MENVDAPDSKNHKIKRLTSETPLLELEMNEAAPKNSNILIKTGVFLAPNLPSSCKL